MHGHASLHPNEHEKKETHSALCPVLTQAAAAAAAAEMAAAEAAAAAAAQIEAPKAWHL